MNATAANISRIAKAIAQQVACGPETYEAALVAALETLTNVDETIEPDAIAEATRYAKSEVVRVCEAIKRQKPHDPNEWPVCGTCGRPYDAWLGGGPNVWCDWCMRHL